MNIAVVSYSLTGNNEALAGRIANIYGAEHIKVKESKTRSMGAIAFDMLFNRTPQISPIPGNLQNVDLLLLVGPVWMGCAASPLRAYLNYIRQSCCKYAFISISGGADNANPKLSADITKRAGKKPVALVDQHIANLLPANPKPQRKDTSAYRINDRDLAKLTDAVVDRLKAVINHG